MPPTPTSMFSMTGNPAQGRPIMRHASRVTTPMKTAASRMSRM
jgi:hypothetical protein